MILPIPEGSTEEGFFGYSLTLNNGDDVDGTTVSVRFTWLERLQGWYLDLLDFEGTPIMTGERMNPGALWKFPGDVPPGELSCFGPDTYGQADLGGSLTLVYFTPAEVASGDSETYRMTLGP